MKKIINPTILLLVSAICFSSCEKFLELDEPTNQISSKIVFTNKKMALAALSEVYANLRSNTLFNGGLNGSGVLLGCYTDELTAVTSQSADYKTFYELAVTPTTPVIDNTWINAYKQIYAVNTIVEGLENSNTYIDENSRKQMLAEALAIRGILHFYLTNLFGAVPYVTITDYQQNSTIPKLSTNDIYVKVQADWEAAFNAISYDYPSPDKTRLNKSAVSLLLARLYLYQKKWTEAKHYAEMAIQNSSGSLETDINKVFLKDSKSTVWQFAPVDTGYNTMEGQFYIFTALPPSTVVLSESILNSFDSQDLRKAVWTKTLSNTSMSYTHPFKYKQNTKTATSLEYSVVLRIEEAYLIIAESLNELNDVNGALTNLNRIRNRAGLSSISGISQSQFRNVLEEERNHEFFTEFGHRFFDLKRWGKLNNVIGIKKPLWQSYMETLPLPERELLANPLLKPQNDGY